MPAVCAMRAVAQLNGIRPCRTYIVSSKPCAMSWAGSWDNAAAAAVAMSTCPEDRHTCQQLMDVPDQLPPVHEPPPPCPSPLPSYATLCSGLGDPQAFQSRLLSWLDPASDSLSESHAPQTSMPFLAMPDHPCGSSTSFNRSPSMQHTTRHFSMPIPKARSLPHLMSSMDIPSAE